MSVLTTIKTGVFLSLLVLVLQGCAVSNVMRKRHVSDDEIQSRWRIIQDGFSFEFKPYPLKPQWNEPAILTLMITTSSDNSSKPVPNALITCTATMPPDQAHMEGLLHNYKKHIVHTEVSPGAYSLDIVFTMGGDWIITYNITLYNEKEFKLLFPIRVKRPDDADYEWETIHPAAPDE